MRLEPGRRKEEYLISSRSARLSAFLGNNRGGVCISISKQRPSHCGQLPGLCTFLTLMRGRDTDSFRESPKGFTTARMEMTGLASFGSSLRNLPVRAWRPLCASSLTGHWFWLGNQPVLQAHNYQNRPYQVFPCAMRQDPPDRPGVVPQVNLLWP